MVFCETEPIGRDVGFDSAKAVRVRRRGLGLIVQKPLPYRSFAELSMEFPAQRKNCTEDVGARWKFWGCC